MNVPLWQQRLCISCAHFKIDAPSRAMLCTSPYTQHLDPVVGTKVNVVAADQRASTNPLHCTIHGHYWEKKPAPAPADADDSGYSAL